MNAAISIYESIDHRIADHRIADHRIADHRS